LFDRILAKRREHVLVKPTTETLRTGETHTVQLKRFRLFEHHDLPGPQHLFHVVGLSALMIVIA
jgi:hypothetical protein